jgi:hypothetical protein
MYPGVGRYGDYIEFTDRGILIHGRSDLPLNRTGKKLEVPVKRMLQGAQLETVADLGSVDDPELLKTYARFALERQTVSP